jgi:hypothetical protein
MLLDSVVPPDHVLGSEIAMRSQQALDQLFSRCEEDQACRDTYAGLRSQLIEYIQDEDQNSKEVLFESFKSGKVESKSFTKNELISYIRLSLYRAETSATLLHTLHEALVNDNFAPIARATELILDALEGSINLGLHNAITCAEEYPFLRAHFSDKHSYFNTNGDFSYMGTQLFDTMEGVCSEWPKSFSSGIEKKPLVSSIPTLLFAGEYDPITPLAYAEQTEKYLSNSKVVEFKGRGHSVYANACGPDLVFDFIENASVDGLDGACASRLNSLPIFLNSNGFSP